MSPDWFKKYAVRGSPILRTFLTALGLGLAALPLWRMSQSSVKPLTGPEITVTDPIQMNVPFSLQLSSAALSVRLRDENGLVLWQVKDPQDTEFTAQLTRLPRQIALDISWSGPPAPRYFAKLRLDAPERDALTHVFDAAGSIDDLWELP
jgi:hypothetical protein